jgi:hypothetical protein
LPAAGTGFGATECAFSTRLASIPAISRNTAMVAYAAVVHRTASFGIGTS